MFGARRPCLCHGEMWGAQSWGSDPALPWDVTLASLPEIGAPSVGTAVDILPIGLGWGL